MILLLVSMFSAGYMSIASLVIIVMIDVWVAHAHRESIRSDEIRISLDICKLREYGSINVRRNIRGVYLVLQDVEGVLHDIRLGMSTNLWILTPLPITWIYLRGRRRYNQQVHLYLTSLYNAVRT